MTELAIVLMWAHTTCAAPPSVTLAAVAAALYRGADPVELVAFACSEHPGGRWSGRCSDAGACGPFQLTATWPLAFGYDSDDRNQALAAADMAAQLMLYSRARCDHDGHGWRAHVKCGRTSRDRCRGPVRRWRQLERELRAQLEVIDGDS